MSSLNLALATLQSLPPMLQEKAVDYIHRLHSESREQRLAALRKTAGCMTVEEADAFEKAIQDGCEKLDDGN